MSILEENRLRGIAHRQEKQALIDRVFSDLKGAGYQDLKDAETIAPLTIKWKIRKELIERGYTEYRPNIGCMATQINKTTNGVILKKITSDARYIYEGVCPVFESLKAAEEWNQAHLNGEYYAWKDSYCEGRGNGLTFSYHDAL